MYFKHSNSLKCLPSRLLSPCSWCTHYCWKRCSNTAERRVGVDRKKGKQKTERRRDGKKKSILLVSVFPSRCLWLFSLPYILIKHWNITVCLLCMARLHLNVIISKEVNLWKKLLCVCVRVGHQQRPWWKRGGRRMFLQHGSRWNADLQTSPGSPGFLKASVTAPFSDSRF